MATRRADVRADEEMGHSRPASSSPHEQEQPPNTMLDAESANSNESDGRRRIWHRIKGMGRRRIGWGASLKAALFSSWINILLVFVPLSWAAHFTPWSRTTQFVLSFFAIMPLEKIFDWGGEQLAMYCGEELGDLIIITLNNAVEATLAIILLIKCELKLLQSTIAGVVLLHLLLIPGTAFFVGGARVWEQTLHQHRSQLNHTLLTIGILALVIPAGFFAAIDHGMPTSENPTTAEGPTPDAAINDTIRMDFLRMARGFAVTLLCVYVLSRFYLHDPPGENNAFQPSTHAPPEILEKERELAEAEPETNPWACILVLCVTVALMGVTAEFLVDSIENVREQGNISEEFFGLILLPILSWSADGAVTIVYFLRTALHGLWHDEPEPPTTIAEARAIELSIQFLLFWMPFLVLLAWWIGKPFTVLFDLFEVTVLIGSCFLVNYVTADAKTNWAEGSMMISFYVMIALSAWYYPGQPEINIMSACQSIVEALATGVNAEE